MGSSIFLNTHPSRPMLIMRPYLCTYNPIKRYGKSREEDEDGGEKERAPSLAQEFKRVEEEKAKAHDTAADQQGPASQTVDKADEAVTGDGDLGSVKKRFKEHQPGAN